MKSNKKNKHKKYNSKKRGNSMKKTNFNKNLNIKRTLDQIDENVFKFMKLSYEDKESYITTLDAVADFFIPIATHMFYDKMGFKLSDIAEELNQPICLNELGVKERIDMAWTYSQILSLTSEDIHLLNTTKSERINLLIKCKLYLAFTYSTDKKYLLDKLEEITHDAEFSEFMRYNAATLYSMLFGPSIHRFSEEQYYI